MKKLTYALLLFALMGGSFVFAAEYHVSVDGSDLNPGTAASPFLTISFAAGLALPGDEIIVHQGTYRERVTPPRGGKSNMERIVYRAADNEEVLIKGSEEIRDWKKHSGTVWKTVLPNDFFGNYNPYQDTILGDWFTRKGMSHHTGEVYLNGKSFYESPSLEGVLDPVPLKDIVDVEGSVYTWYCEVDETSTTIYANFHGADPRKELVEINFRKACFYPEQISINYLTISGFNMSQAATQWAAPTAEQIGLIGTHWSKGWIIENNVISHSKCVGVSLGKDRATGHNVWLNNPAKDGATHYNEVIFRALKIGWSKETIGSHIVRNNTISECGQAGIVGSLGAVFSQIYDNHIYNIWAKRMFAGAEMAGIKIHGSIDMLIRNNRIHHAGRGIWLDWMAQGTRVTRNLLYENTTDDLFCEMDHGPYLVDNNIFLSPVSLRDWSVGGAFVHNLMAGLCSMSKSYLDRFVPYMLAHSTSVAGVRNIAQGDNRFYNNIFVKPEEVKEDKWLGSGKTTDYGLAIYKEAGFPVFAGGNVFYNGAKPLEPEEGPIIRNDVNPAIRVVVEGENVYLEITLDDAVGNQACRMVTTELLGTTINSELPWENPDGSVLKIDGDYSGKERPAGNPTPGPFEDIGSGKIRMKVW